MRHKHKIEHAAKHKTRHAHQHDHKRHLVKHHKPKHHNPILYAFIVLFAVCGLYVIYRSLAGSYVVYTDNVEYWRTRIAGCESGSGPNSQPRYTAFNGIAHYGAYQFDIGTWRSNVSAETAAQYPKASDAPPAVQDQAFRTAFSRRGTQPWNASYYCWATSAAPKPVALALPDLLPSIPASSYNVSVTGQITLDGQGKKGVILQTCNDNYTVETNDEGKYTLSLPNGSNFCLRVASGIPEGYRLTKTNNNPEHAKDTSYENQRAGVDAYQNIFYLFSAYYTWDRNTDKGYNFIYSHV